MERGFLRAAVGELTAPADEAVRHRAAELAGRYDELAAEAEAAAIRWQWATPTSGFGDVEPLRLERMGCTPGRWLDRPPPPWRAHEAIGYDALDRVVCVRQYDDTGEVWLERFATWSRDGVEVACFRAPLECGGEALPARLQAVVQLRMAGACRWRAGGSCRRRARARASATATRAAGSRVSRRTRATSAASSRPSSRRSSTTRTGA